MAQIELSDADDKKLREIAPDFLQGDRNHAARVGWLIREFLRIRNGENAEPGCHCAEHAADPLGD